MIILILINNLFVQVYYPISIVFSLYKSMLIVKSLEIVYSYTTALICLQLWISLQMWIIEFIILFNSIECVCSYYSWFSSYYSTVVSLFNWFDNWFAHIVFVSCYIYIIQMISYLVCIKLVSWYDDMTWHNDTKRWNDMTKRKTQWRAR